MTNLTPTAGWDSIPQLETTTLAQGGPGGIMNAQAQALLNRTEQLNNTKATASSVSAGDAATLASAKSYADSGDAAVLSAANSHADSGDAANLASAKSYADSGDAATLSAANSHADSGDTASLAAAKSYADGGDASNLLTAKAYADSVAANATPADGSVTDQKIAWSTILGRVVDSIASLRALDSSKHKRAFVAGYYAPGDFGGGAYYCDSTDTTSADNGGTVIVGADGARWKLIYQGVLRVRQFGAKGDGATDDTAAIQATINAFNAKGGKILFDPGSYGIVSGVTLPETIAATGFDGYQFEGVGQGVTLKKLSGAGAILNISGARCRVSGLTFNANSVAANCIYLNTKFDGQTTLIEDCAFLSCATGGQGIYNNDGDSYLIRNCYFLNCGNWAFETRCNAVNSSFAANYVQGSGGVHLNNVATVQAEGVRITDNTILATGGSGYAIDVEYGLEIIIANNIFDQLLTGGVRVRNNASYVKMIGNWFGGGTAGHVILGDNANRIFISENTFEGGATSQVIANSAALGNINSLTIQNNIHGNINASAQGILLLSVRRASVCGNIMPGPTGSNSIYWGSGAAGIIANNAIWKAPNVDGTATSANNVVG